ncbi:MAG: hypothetical protein ACLP4W_10925 [Mycobacterium sp.]|uniref:hypothetical protein n=1 Tax=Mycobacterium sp. TaxID=1785 RepID=UPI003F9487AC
MPKIPPLSPAQLSERARIAANTRWAKEPDRLAATAPGRRAMLEVLECQVDPEGILPPTERAKRAENARKAQLARARLKASRKRQETAALARADFARTKLVEEALQATFATILETVPLSDEARERIAELIRQGGASNATP